MIIIQKLTNEYVDQVADLFRDEWLLHADNTRSYSKKLIEARNIAEWVTSRTLEEKSFTCLVALDKTVVQGLMLYRIYDAISIAKNPKYMKVEDIYVKSSARGKGIAKLLLAEVEKLAGQQGIKEVMGDIYVFNEASWGLFESTGFTPEYVNYMKVLGGSSTTVKPNRVERVKLYCDGGSRGNPGPSAGGYVILNMDNTVVKSNGKYLGITTNNQAEYHSLKGGLEMVDKLGVREVDVYMDSLLVVNQMKAIFKIKNRDLWPIHDAIIKLLPKFKKVSFTHIPRELNKLADQVVNETLDANKN